MRSLLRLLPLLLMFFLLGCNNSPDQSANIEGTFSGSPIQFLKIYQLLPGGNRFLDSVQTDGSGNFSVSIRLKETAFYQLRCDAQNAVTLVVSPGEKIRLRGDGRNLKNAYNVEGSENSEFYAEYFRFTAQNLEKVDSLSKVFGESQAKADFPTIKKELDSTYLVVFDKQKQQLINFVNSHLHSLTSLLVIDENFGPNEMLSPESHPVLFLSLDSALMLNYKTNPLVTDFHQGMLKVKTLIDNQKTSQQTLMPGKIAPEISLPDAGGKTIKLSSLKGKLTIVCFWASWNALSRKTNLELTALFGEFHPKGLEIFSVSLDTDAEQWERAYRLDKAYWFQLRDPKGLMSDYGKLFGIQSLPKLILIDKTGKIILSAHSVDEIKSLINSNI